MSGGIGGAGAVGVLELATEVVRYVMLTAGFLGLIVAIGVLIQAMRGE